jgi:hypothetical protein
VLRNRSILVPSNPNSQGNAKAKPVPVAPTVFSSSFSSNSYHEDEINCSNDYSNDYNNNNSNNYNYSKSNDDKDIRQNNDFNVNMNNHSNHSSSYNSSFNSNKNQETFNDNSNYNNYQSNGNNNDNSDYSNSNIGNRNSSDRHSGNDIQNMRPTSNTNPNPNNYTSTTSTLIPPNNLSSLSTSDKCNSIINGSYKQTSSSSLPNNLRAPTLYANSVIPTPTINTLSKPAPKIGNAGTMAREIEILEQEMENCSNPVRKIQIRKNIAAKRSDILELRGK